jgi:hypothetical protein
MASFRALNPLRLCSDRSHYTRPFRDQLSDILRPYWKDAPFDDEQRKQMYGLSNQDFSLMDKLDQADIAVLPMTWNYYRKHGQVEKALAFIHAARRACRPVLSYVSGDEGVAVPPECEDVYVVRLSGCRSRRRKRQVAQPVFFDDPATIYPGLISYDRPSKSGGLPSVGFCGQASFHILKLAWDELRGIFRHAAYGLGVRLEEPQPLYPPVLLRARALRILRRSPLVDTQFIVRSRYRAGTIEPVSRERTSQEFYENIGHTDYTLCLRGGGNFSKRFYETMAMGRIPVLVDTDCLLPFDSILPWDSYIVRVLDVDLACLAKRVADDFSAGGSARLADRKHRCRRLWEDWLSFSGFHRQLVRLILDAEAAQDPWRVDGRELGQRSADPQREESVAKVGCDVQDSPDRSQS